MVPAARENPQGFPPPETRGEESSTDGEHTTVREAIGGERRRVLRVRASVMAAHPSTE